MALRDRGNIKWTSMMLPEHVSMLREWADEDSYEAEKLLDEQHLEEMDTVMAEAMETGRLVTITHFERKRHQLLIGNIHHYNMLEQKLHIVDRFGEVHYLPVRRLTDIRFTEE